MKKLNIRFEPDSSLKEIEIIVRAPERDEQVSALIERVSGSLPDMLIVNDLDGARLKVPVHDIVSVSVRGKNAQIVTEDSLYTVRQTLQALESKLEHLRFARISRYEIVNLDKVRRFDFTLTGTLRLEMVGGMETWASRRNIPQIRKKLLERTGEQ